MFSLALKRVKRDWKLFSVMSIGVILASTFFTGIIVGSDTTAALALEEKLESIVVDLSLSPETRFYSEVGRWMQKSMSSSNWTEALRKTKSIEDVVDAEIVSCALYYAKTEDNKTNFITAAIENKSLVYKGLTVMEGAPSLKANETYIVIEGEDSHQIKIGDNLTLDLWFVTTVPAFHVIRVPLNLRVVGFVKLSDESRSIVRSGIGSFMSTSVYSENLAILDWDSTFSRIIDYIFEKQASYNVIYTTISVYVNRQSLINPWDIHRSFLTVKSFGDRLTQINSAYGLEANSTTGNNLLCIEYYEQISSKMKNSALITAIPVFFMAWYTATTMSDAAVNTKRRDTGLLLVKGLSRGQLIRLFILESIWIGLLGCVSAIALNVFIVPLIIIGGFGGHLQLPVIKLETAIYSIVFSLCLAFLAIFKPALSASSLSAIDALREYYETPIHRSFGSRWAWIAFTLGSFEMLLRYLGTGIFTNFSISKIQFLSSFREMALFLENLPSYFGPILFFWGFTKIFVSVSVGFHEAVSKAVNRIVSLLGRKVDLMVLASKNVRRQPIRVISLTFMIALIVGYSISVLGFMASEKDLILREIKLDVGSDLSLTLYSHQSYPEKLKMVQGLSEVESASVEHSFSTGGFAGNIMRFKAFNPEQWGRAAYYEKSWFIDCDIEEALKTMASDGQTIILDRAISTGVKVGDHVTINLDGQAYPMKVVGFFSPGPESVYWSYVPSSFVNKTRGIIYNSKIVIKPTAKSGDAIMRIRSALSDLGYLSSADQKFRDITQNIEFSNLRNIELIGVVITALASSLGVALITFIGIRDRLSDISLMSIRGLSHRQIFTFFFSGEIYVEAFAILLGAVTGIVTLRSNIALTEASFVSSVFRHIVFPPEFTTMLALIITLVFVSTVMPIMIKIRDYMYQIRGVVG